MSRRTMTVKPRGSRLLHRFARDRRGVSAVEFALLAPVMIALYLGCVETSDGVAAGRKVSLTAAALANLAAQVSTISSSDMTNILDASSAIIVPYSASNLKISVSCIAIDANKNATVKWSVTRNGTVNSGSITIPSALAVPSTQLILAEASYAYTPAVGYTITGTINLHDKMYMSPRVTAPTYGSTSCT
jgi:Flp pilus assembly protein TadG